MSKDKQICLLLKSKGVDVYKVGTLSSIADACGVPRQKSISRLVCSVFQKFIKDDAEFDCYTVPIASIPTSSKVEDSADATSVVVC